MRTVEKVVNGEWLTCEFYELKVNDNFRLFDDGVMFVGDKEQSVFTSVSEPYKNKDDYWQVDIA